MPILGAKDIGNLMQDWIKETEEITAFIKEVGKEVDKTILDRANHNKKNL